MGAEGTTTRPHVESCGSVSAAQFAEAHGLANDEGSNSGGRRGGQSPRTSRSNCIYLFASLHRAQKLWPRRRFANDCHQPMPTMSARVSGQLSRSDDELVGD